MLSRGLLADRQTYAVVAVTRDRLCDRTGVGRCVTKPPIGKVRKLYKQRDRRKEQHGIGDRIPGK